MSRTLWITITIVVLALAWAALDDITTSPEPSYGMEWAMVGVATLWLAAPVLLRLARGLSARRNR